MRKFKSDEQLKKVYNRGNQKEDAKNHPASIGYSFILRVPFGERYSPRSWSGVKKP